MRYGTIYADEPMQSFLKRKDVTIEDLFEFNPELATHFGVTQLKDCTVANKALLAIGERKRREKNA
jgi:hypothetical protein